MGNGDESDFELAEAIEELLESDQIDHGSPPYGVAQQVINSGYESLSARQRAIYDKDANFQGKFDP